MVKINPSSICTKYEESIDTWLLPIPTIENGQYKLRCFMSENKNKKRSERTWESKKRFIDVYTYNVPSLDYLVMFYMFKSMGQAYNGLFKFQQDRTDFITEDDHEKGLFMMEKVNKTALLGKSAWVCDQIQQEFDKIGFEFDLNPISEKERKTVDEIVIEVKKMYDR